MKTYITCIDEKWYAFAGDPNNNQVYSIGNDCPHDNGTCWFAKWTESGIKYVASASPTRNAAYKKAHRHGEYNGEV